MLRTQIEFKIGSILTSDLDLSSEAKAALDFAKEFSLASGTGQSEADQQWFDTREILASGNDDLDLTGGITNGLNQTVTFVRLKGIVLYSRPSNANNIRIGKNTVPGPPGPPWQDDAGNIVRPGGLLFLIAPDPVAYPVSGLPGDTLRITNMAGGSAVTYDIILIGATA